MPPMISISGFSKHYESGPAALDASTWKSRRARSSRCSGPNGAGKTTLIGIVCGIVSMTSGTIPVDGHDIAQRLSRGALEGRAGAAGNRARHLLDRLGHRAFSRGLFGRGARPAYIEQLLRDLSLWEKRDSRIVELSGGMKRRVMIAKALSHEPEVLFLDEPTAGVDVNLRRDMWALVRKLREQGRHGHSDDALHRGGRGDGRPGRRDQRRKAHARRG